MSTEQDYLEKEKIGMSSSEAVPVVEYDIAADEVTQDIVEASEGQYTEAEYKKVLRRIDLILIPMMWILYGTQQADKTSLATQATFGLSKDTGMKGQEYAWLTTIFYISYLVAEFPAQYLMQRVNVGKTLSVFVITWGVIVTLIGVCKSWPPLMALRALQGVFECSISPAFLLLTGAWYKKSEQASRTLIWGTSNAGFGIIIAFIEYGMGSHILSHPGPIAAWQAISFLLGPWTILLGVISWFVLGTPREVRWLTPEQKRIALARVVDNQTGSDAKARPEWKWDQVKEAFMDPQTFFMVTCMTISSLPNGGITSFGKLVFVSLGFTNLETLLEGTIPQNVLSVAWFLIVAFITQRYKNTRIYCMIFGLIPTVVGFLVLGKYTGHAGHLWLKWGMFFLTVMGNLAGVAIWTFLPSNVAGRTKKTVVSTLLFIAYCVGNAAGSQIFKAKDAPYYTPAIVTCAALLATQIVLFIAWRTYYVLVNRRRDRAAVADGLSPEQCLHLGKLLAEEDATDLFGNRHFRYSY